MATQTLAGVAQLKESLSQNVATALLLESNRCIPDQWHFLLLRGLSMGKGANTMALGILRRVPTNRLVFI